MSIENKWFDMSRANNEQGEKSTEAEISIYDQIGGFGISANDFIDGLKSLGDVETINLRIASGGGSIVDGNTIFNALRPTSLRRKPLRRGLLTRSKQQTLPPRQLMKWRL